MMPLFSGFLAKVPTIDAEPLRTSFEWGRIQSPADWAVPGVLLALVACYVVWMYRKDSVELRRGVAGLLMLLRIGAFAALAAVYLQPQWRHERDIKTNSRVVLLADTSLSMARSDAAGPGTSSAAETRSQQLATALQSGKLIDALRGVHEVSLARFDSSVERVTTYFKRGAPPSGTAKQPNEKKNVAPGDQKDEHIDLTEALAPRGGETRLGQALRQVMGDERGSPLSGIVVFTDGQQNAGIDPVAALEMAREARLPIFTVGMGTTERPVNVRISELTIPARAYPNDPFVVTGYLQSQGLTGKSVQVELSSRPAAAGADKGASKVEGTEQVTLGADGEAVPVKFQLTSPEPGRRTLSLRVTAPAGDRNPADNQREADMEVVDRKTRVLLFAGGPSREYQFVRNQYKRDKDVAIDVLLQTATPASSQDANSLLSTFPSTREEMFAYDAVLAFDPDWHKLDASQIDLLEQWVGSQAGGLIVVAGPIYTEASVQDPKLAKIAGLYPVEFQRRFASLDDSQYENKEPWPLELTREGLEAPQLGLEDSAAASADVWKRFKGVYGYFAVKGAKPSATVYARFSDPKAAVSGQAPAYMAGQLYGSGRVFYLGSGEIWRLRALDEAYFERFYTKLLRFVTQGRLLRGSSRGVLLVEQDRYLLGATVTVIAQLSTKNLTPLEAPTALLQIVAPDGTPSNLRLLADPSRAGTFRGQFTVRHEGTYRLEMPIPDSGDERLTRRLQVDVPDLENEHTERNDALLREIAEKTGGRYYPTLAEAIGTGAAPPPLVAQLRDQSRVSTVTTPPESLWDNAYVLAGICSVLCLEWLIRRLSKLA